MLERTKRQIEEYAKAQAPREACGLILNYAGKELFQPCANVSELPESFEIDPKEYAKWEDFADVMAIVHSHVDRSPRPSQADLVSCEFSGLPWHIVSVPDFQWHSFAPTGYEAPLIGREYSHGVLDCYTLVRDWFALDGVKLPDFHREWEWWKKGSDLYMSNFSRLGFYPVDPPYQRGDVFLMNIRSEVVNHAGVHVGDGIMLHHAVGRLSCREVYGGFWEKNTRLVVRRRLKG